VSASDYQEALSNMTYCLAIAAKDGLVFCSDSRTNAGPDVLSTYSKMHIYDPGPDRMITLLSAGNLATTQAIIAQIESDVEDGEEESLATCRKMIDVANYVSRVSREQQARASDSTGDADVDTSVSIIVGGQIAGSKPSIYMIYAAGNFISISDETRYLQIGESKYGKPILDRILRADTSLEDAARCALVSMDSTMRANATVGPPVEVLVYENDTFESDHYIKLTEEDSYLTTLRRAWGEAIKAAFSDLPQFEWERRSASLHAVGDESPLKEDRLT
jgi:putative proteasome-type protease